MDTMNVNSVSRIPYRRLTIIAIRVSRGRRFPGARAGKWGEQEKFR